jgi:hypothetical protein
MVEDITMSVDGGESKEASDDSKTPEPTAPPLEAAAQRLERLLGGGLTDKDRMLDFYTNPVKVVRRWLGTSSGAAAAATADDVKAAAAKLLDPAGPCGFGRSLLVSVEVPPVDDTSPDSTYCTLASAREVESWLLSLAVALLWKQANYAEAFELSQKAIQIMMNHMEATDMRITTVSAVSSLFPLLARMYRWQSLVAESMAGQQQLQPDMRAVWAQAHNIASLRRDADTQATLLNSMLRELLLSSQGMCKH